MNLSEIKANLDELVEPTLIDDPTDGEFLLQLVASNILEAGQILASDDPSTWKTPGHQLAVILQHVFEGQLIIGTNLFVGFQPDAPDVCITIYEQGGGEQPSTLPLDNHLLQILCRHSSYETGYNLLNQIKAALQSMPALFVDAEKWVGVWVTTNIVGIGRDAKSRPLFSSNYRATIETQKDINRTLV